MQKTFVFPPLRVEVYIGDLPEHEAPLALIGEGIKQNPAHAELITGIFHNSDRGCLTREVVK